MSALAPSRKFESVPGMSRWALVKQHPVIAYWILTLAISWLIWLPLIFQAQGWGNFQAPFALHYLGAFGPLIAALVMTWMLDGAQGLQELWSRITRFRVGALSWVIAVGGPLALFGFALFETVVVRNPFPDLAQLGQVNYLPYLGIWVLPFWLVTFGFGEEIGWRGFALPRLQKGHSALWATLILGVMWSLWHLPAFFYLDTYIQLGLGVFPMFALGIIAGAVVMTWLYNTSGGSILMVAIWHALFDLLTATKATDGLMQASMSVLMMVAAVAIVIMFKPANLSSAPKQVL